MFKQDSRCSFYRRKGQLCGFRLPRLFVLCVSLQWLTSAGTRMGSYCMCGGYKKCDGKKTTEAKLCGAADKDRESVRNEHGWT